MKRFPLTLKVQVLNKAYISLHHAKFESGLLFIIKIKRYLDINFIKIKILQTDHFSAVNLLYNVCVRVKSKIRDTIQGTISMKL